MGGGDATHRLLHAGEHFLGVLGALRAAGVAIEEASLPPDWGPILEYHQTVMAVEAAAYHEPRLRRHPDDYGPRIRSLIEEGLATRLSANARDAAKTWSPEAMLAAYRSLYDDLVSERASR